MVVELRVFAGIDVRVTLNGQEPDEVLSKDGILMHVFKAVAPGKHSVLAKDVMSFSESREIVLEPPTPTPTHADVVTEQQQDPSDLFKIDVQVQPSSPSVGDVVTITAVAFGKGGIPQYRLYGELEPVLALQSERAVNFNTFGKTATWMLLAKETGTVEIVVNVNYETSYTDQDGRPFYQFTRDSSQPFTITVSP